MHTKQSMSQGEHNNVYFWPIQSDLCVVIIYLAIERQDAVNKPVPKNNALCNPWNVPQSLAAIDTCCTVLKTLNVLGLGGQFAQGIKQNGCLKTEWHGQVE